MQPSPQTRPSLVVRLRNPRDETAWSEFLAIYEPLLLRLLRRNGLQDSDARDVCQQALAAVSQDVERWHPDGRQASFRRWLFQIARHRMLKYLATNHRQAQPMGGTDALHDWSQLADNDRASQEFLREYRQQLVMTAARQVRHEFRESTWEAFHRTCVEGEPVADVARALGTTPGNVYVARSRIIARLRERVHELENDELEK